MLVDAALGALPTLQGLKYVLRAMKNNKAVPDDLPADILKLGLKEAPAILTAAHGILAAA